MHQAVVIIDPCHEITGFFTNINDIYLEGSFFLFFFLRLASKSEITPGFSAFRAYDFHFQSRVCNADNESELIDDYVR